MSITIPLDSGYKLPDRWARITRIYSSDQGTFGDFVTDRGFKCSSGELPFLDNEAQLSCIPKGEYICVYGPSLKHGFCYHIQNVPGRTNIEIHPANLMGDSQKGFVAQLLGCIALGADIVTFPKGTKLGEGNNAITLTSDQRGVSCSKITVAAMESHFNKKPFKLTIE